MAQNPMQRKMTNSFLLGMFITLLIAAVIVFVLLSQINKLKGEKEELEDAQVQATQTVYVATETIPEGQIAYGVDDQTANVITKIQQKTIVTDMNEGLLAYDDLETIDPNGNVTANVMKARVEIPAGTVLTKSMLENTSVDDSERLMEYNMISLPSQLLDGMYIDVRILLPTGEDFVVVSKKYVEQINYTTIWMKMSEHEIETLSNAIIESYIIDGAKLYATVYSSPTSQVASDCTYVPNNNVRVILDKMVKDGEIKAILKGNWSTFENAGYRKVIDNYLNDYDSEERLEKATEGINEEVKEMQSTRDAFLESMGY